MSPTISNQKNVLEGACLEKTATLSDDSHLYSAAFVYESAQVTNKSVLRNGVRVFGSARVSNSKLRGRVTVCDHAIVRDARVEGCAELDGYALVTASDQVLSGDTGRYLWTTFVEKKPGRRKEKILRFGCERHPLSKWTAAFQREKVRQHTTGDKEVVRHLATVVRTARAFWRER